ncbi:unnamed protein product, partial [Didymodactylos carnosus]
RGREGKWRSSGTTWEQFHCEPGTIAQCLENAKLEVAKRAAKIIDVMRRFFKRKEPTEPNATNPTPCDDNAKSDSDKFKLIEDPIPADASTQSDNNKRTHANAYVRPATASVAQASVEAATTNTSASAVGDSASVCNANARVATASAHAATTAASANIANVSAQALSANTSVSASGATVNAGNTSAKFATADAHAGVHGVEVNVGNVSANGCTASASADIGLTVSAFNASFSPFSVHVDGNPFHISFGNVGFGGITIGWPNPLNLFNLGTGGGGGGGGGGAGSEGTNQGDIASTGNGNPPSGANGHCESSGHSNSNLVSQGSSQATANTGSPPGNFIQQVVSAVGTCESKLSDRMPNWHYSGNGNVYRNGELIKTKNIKRYKQPKNAPYKHVERNSVPGADGDSNLDPIGVPGSRGEARQVLETHFPGEVNREYHDTDSCNIWLMTMANQLQDIHHVTGINSDNLGQNLPVLLPPSDHVLLVSMKSHGDHHFAVTGHGDQVMITHAWQGDHQLRNEPLMHRDQFVNQMQTLMNPNTTPKNRRAASHALFRAPEHESFGVDIPAQFSSMFRGRLGPPLVAHTNTNRSAPGLQQTPDPSIQARRPVILPSSRELSNRQTNEAEPADPEVTGLVREYFTEIRGVDETDYQDALTFATSPQGIAEQQKEDDQPRELCRYCAPKGRPCCLTCFLGRSGRKIVPLGSGGNVYGFSS